MRSILAALGLLTLAVVNATPFDSAMERRAACAADNCARAITGTAGRKPVSARESDCSSFFVITVTPVSIITTTVYSGTSIVTATSSSVTSSVQVATSTVTATATVTAAMKKRQNSMTSVTTQNNAPTYASACSGPGRYASACSCFASATYSTRTTTTTTSTSTSTVYAVYTMSTTTVVVGTSVTTSVTTVVQTTTTTAPAPKQTNCNAAQEAIAAACDSDFCAIDVETGGAVYLDEYDPRTGCTTNQECVDRNPGAITPGFYCVYTNDGDVQVYGQTAVCGGRDPRCAANPSFP